MTGAFKDGSDLRQPLIKHHKPTPSVLVTKEGSVVYSSHRHMEREPGDLSPDNHSAERALAQIVKCGFSPCLCVRM